MYSNKGFSLIELMITVGIIGILMLIALPMYRDYVLRVRITEAINDVTILVRDSQLAYAGGSIKSPVDILKLRDDVHGDAHIDGAYAWCENGTYLGAVSVPKDKLHLAGIASPYIKSLTIFGQTTLPCEGVSPPSQQHPVIVIQFTLDAEALGIFAEKTSLHAVKNMFRILISDKFTYIDMEGNETLKESGVLSVCAVGYSVDYELSEQLDIPFNAIPPHCRNSVLRIDSANRAPMRILELQ